MLSSTLELQTILSRSMRNGALYITRVSKWTKRTIIFRFVHSWIFFIWSSFKANRNRGLHPRMQPTPMNSTFHFSMQRKKNTCNIKYLTDHSLHLQAKLWLTYYAFHRQKHKSLWDITAILSILHRIWSDWIRLQ